ncbi:unnamed protein product [Mytilus coruscus]|uniref:Uncharacterized protein n=1 Tax=Mytilus coruscus TaxID=42192 RepID=A0A6J8CBA1_MYTCO|nr:unnamed protein product [Mytilus coruscus]
MGLFEGISKFALVSAILTAVGFLVHLIGYGAPYWFKSGIYHSGLWKSCAGSICGDFVGSSFLPAWLEATQAFETLAFLAILAALIVMGLKFTVMKEQKILLIVIFILQFASVGLILLGVIIYGAENSTTSFGFAFVFVIIASIIMLVAGVFSFLDWRGSSSPA